MSVVVRVRIPTTGLTKTIRFTGNMSVHEACKTIIEKLADGGGNSGGKDHGIYKPLTEDSGTKGGKWLKAEKTLDFYDLKSNELIEFRKKHDVLKIKLLDGSVKTLLTDLSMSVDEVVADLAKRIGLKNPEEFSLQIEGLNEWMKKEGSILEQLDNLQTGLVLRKKYFVNDANVDRDDPVQLHLVYIQSRDDILQGRHPTQKDEAIQLAALQCQIDGGNVILNNPQLNLKNVLAAQWQKERAVDKDVIKEWKKLTGMSEMNAKYRYVQFCRSLKTYGLTIFHVKERPKNAKKLTQFMLGFTRDAIIRLDVECKVEKTWPLIYLKRWAASTDTFTMDFGSHEPDYITVITEEGEAISQLIAGYIDILLKKQKDSTVIIEDDKEEIAEVKNIGKTAQAIATATTVSYYGANGQSFGTSVTEMSTAPAAIAKMKSALLVEKVPVQENSALTPVQKKQQMTAHQKNVETVVGRLASLVTGTGPIDPTQLKGLAKQMSTGLENLLLATRNASSVGLDQSEEIIESMKDISDSLSKLIQTADEASRDPTNATLKVAVKHAQAEVNANFAKLDAIQRNVKTDESYQKLFTEMSKAVSAAAINLVGVADKAKLTNVAKQGTVSSAREALSQAATQLASISMILAPTANDNKCKASVLGLKDDLNNSVKQLAFELKTAGISEDDSSRLLDAIKGIQGSLIGLVSCIELPDISGGKDAEEFSSSSQALLQSTTALMASVAKPQAIIAHAALIEKSLESMKSTIKSLSDNPVAQKRMAQEFKTLEEAATKLQAVASEASANPSNVKAQAQLRSLCQQVAQAAEVLINDGGEKVAVAALYNSAKEAAAISTGLFVSVNSLAGSINDFKLEQDLLNMAKLTSEALNGLVGTLRDLPASASATDNLGTDTLLGASDQFTPIAMKLVAAAKSAVPKITNPDLKKQVVFEADNTNKALQKLLATKKVTKATVGQAEVVQATEQFDAATSDLEAALVAVKSGMVDPPTLDRDESLVGVQSSIEGIKQIVKVVSCRLVRNSVTSKITDISKDSPEEIGFKLKELAFRAGDIVSSGKSLTGTLTDNGKQRELLNGIKAVNDQLASFLSASKGVVTNSADADLMKLLAESANSVTNSVNALMDITSFIAPKDVEDHMKATSSDLEELAEKELSQASQVISNAVQKMLAAQDALRTRKSTAININLQEIQMTEAVLEAVHAIGKSTGTLVGAASSVQHEYNKLVQSHTSTAANPYRRDPAWAKGLISASQQVAAAVTHLVAQSEKVATGEAKDEALIVAAKAVAAETAKLVTASSVKAADSKSNAHAKLNEAAKQVNASTRALQEAALASSDYKNEQEDESKYALPKNKIQELNDQVEILKLERELERRKAALFANRKKEYEQKAPVSEEPETTGKVAWRKSNAFQHKPTGLEGLLN